MSVAYPTVREFLADPGRHEKAFFSRVSLPNGTFKTTHARRLDDVNEAVLPFLTKMKQPLRIMDVAASSGISTAEWRDHMLASGVKFSIVAGDLLNKASLVKVPGMELLVDEAGNVLHIDTAGIGWPSRVKSTTRFALTPLRLTAQFAYRFFPRKHVAEVPIMAGSIGAVKDDLTLPNPPDFIGSFNVIRAANILNLGYFPQEILSRIVCNLKERLAENGLLIVCRTEPQKGNHGAVYALTGTRFRQCLRIGRGSEVGSIIQNA